MYATSSAGRGVHSIWTEKRNDIGKPCHNGQMPWAILAQCSSRLCHAARRLGPGSTLKASPLCTTQRFALTLHCAGAQVTEWVKFDL
jgi:hypothetical protein